METAGGGGTGKREALAASGTGTFHSSVKGWLLVASNLLDLCLEQIQNKMLFFCIIKDSLTVA